LREALPHLVETNGNDDREREEEEERENKTDRPDLAFLQNVEMTKDPVLGYVPYERLEKAREEMQQMISANKTSLAISGVNWESRGPKDVGGRTRALMFDPNDATKKKVWAGGVGGGLWYTNDITATTPVWTQIDNGLWDNIAITTMAYNPANTQEFYVGTGEGWFNGGAQRGGGIWKTTNGGTTWALLASTATGAYNSSNHFHYVNKIVVKNNGTVFAATRGYFINNGGIMRSTNGGTSWSRVQTAYVASTTYYDRAADIEVAANGDLYASFGIFGSPKLFKSTNTNNGGSGTWTDLSSNIVMANAQRIELACAPSDANVVYAVAQGGSGDNDTEWFKKSIDGGTTWSSIAIPRMVNDNVTHFTRSQAWYDLVLAVHPTNANYVIAGGIDLHRTTNGGTSWTGISHWYGGFGKPYVHADNHVIAFRPGASNEMIFGNDGGVYYSTNAGNSAETPSFSIKNANYNVTQYYACATKNEPNSHYFLAGAQDNGTQKFIYPKIGTTTNASGGDGAFCHIDQINPNIQISSYTFNSLYRSLDGGISFPSLLNDQTTGHFINPSEYDSQRKILYAASNNDLLKKIIGIDATASASDIAISVGTAQVSTLKMSPYNDVLFLGITNGRIYKLTNASTASPTLTRIDNGLAGASWVSSIDVGANDNQLLVTYSNYGVTSVYETTNGGTAWNSKEGNLPDMPIRWAIYNPNDRNQVLAATELGVWTTDNFQPGTSAAPVWGVSNTNLANVRCDMLKYRPADKMVVLATHGRGLFTSDIFTTSTIADFAVETRASCLGSITASFSDGSIKPNNSWAWDIDNNGTTDYTTQNPTHTYTAPGLYSVKLTVNGGTATVTKEKYILVTNGGPVAGPACSSNSNSGNGFGIGISYFSLGSISSTTSYNDGYFNNYVCQQATPLSISTNYTVTITTGTANNEGAAVYIDYNNNGTYEGSEVVATFAANKVGTRSANFNTPSTGVTYDVPLRLRVVSKFAGIPANATDIGLYGQAEDYTAYFKNPIVLPITLSYFEAKCNENAVNLNWETSSEMNNDYFNLEKSKDGVHFENIGQIKGAGNSNSALNYAFIDETPLPNTYYRLKQTDFEGKYSYSDVISTNCANAISISAFPNPTTGIFKVQGFGEKAVLMVYNAQKQQVFNANVKDSNAQIDISNQPAGTYFIHLLINSKVVVEKMVIKI
jgi:PKD repeat protein